MKKYFYLAGSSNTDDRPLRRSIQRPVRYSPLTIHYSQV